MPIDFLSTTDGFELRCDDQPRALFDDLSLTVWGEELRLKAGGLQRHTESTSESHDEVGRHVLVSFPFTTNSLRHPSQFRLNARCYQDEPLVLLELQPSVSQPVFGTETCARLRLASLPGCRRAVYLHQRVDEYGRDAVGCWWAQARFLADPTRDNLWDFGLCCCWQAADDQYAVLLPTRAGGAVSRLKGTENGLELVASGWCGTHAYPRLPLGILAFGAAPGEAIDQALRAASRLGEWSFSLRDEKVYPQLSEYLGYATWGSLGQHLRVSRVVEGLNSLRAEGVPLHWVMLGEGWQRVNGYQQLRGYDADSIGFPGGLHDALVRLRGEGGVSEVGLWCTLQGAWAGLDPSASFVCDHPARFEQGTDGTTIPSTTESGRAFWDDAIAYWREAGVDLLQVDNQGSTRNLYLGRQPLDEAMRGALGNLEQAADAAGMYLSASMSLHPECLYHYGSTNLVRVTPEVVDDLEATKKHLANSVQVGAWVSRIAWPDYDAFPSTHPAARALAVFTALSGGPVCLCDRIGEHDANLARRLCLDDALLLQPAAPAEPPASRWFNDPLADGNPLVARALAGRVPRRESPADIADPWDTAVPPVLVGVANVTLSGAALTATLSLAELDLPPAEAYAVATHFTGRHELLAPDETFELELAELDADVVTIAPVRHGAAVLGLTDKLLGASGCLWEENQVIGLPAPGRVLVYDALERTPTGMDGQQYRPVEQDREPGPGEYRREGVWVTIHTLSTVVRMNDAGA